VKAAGKEPRRPGALAHLKGDLPDDLS